jgi:molybdate transport system permease protein
MMDIDLTPVLLSLRVALVATVVSLPFAIASAWILSRKTFRGKIVLETLVMAPLVFPPLVTGYLLLLLFGQGSAFGKFFQDILGVRIAFTWIGAAVAAAVVAFPLMVRAIQISFDSVDKGLEGMSRTLGAGRWDSFFTITLPLALPGVISGTIIGLARSLGEFGATIVLAGNLPGKTQTIPLAIYSAINRPGGERTALVLMIISIILSVVALVASYYLNAKRPGSSAASGRRIVP